MSCIKCKSINIKQEGARETCLDCGHVNIVLAVKNVRMDSLAIFKRQIKEMIRIEEKQENG